MYGMSGRVLVVPVAALLALALLALLLHRGAGPRPFCVGDRPAASTALASWQDSPHVQRFTSYRPELRRRALDKGVTSFGSRSRARRAMHKLLIGRGPMSVSFIGGSITLFDNNTDGFIWRTHSWLKETFPNSDITVTNGAVGGMASSYFSLCYQSHVPRDADIVSVELNVNDGEGAGYGDTPVRRAHERLIRKLMLLPNRPAVVEYIMWPYYAGDWKDYLQPAQHEALELPLRTEPFWPGDAWAENHGLPHDRWWPKPLYRNGDVIHLNHRGHNSDLQVASELVIHWMQHMLDDVARHPLEPEDEEEAQRPLPEPMFKGNYEAANNTCMTRKEFKNLVTVLDGAVWEWVIEGTDVKPKWGYISKQPGSSMEFTVNTNVAANSRSQGHVLLALGYLKSYEHMGQFQVDCIQGCACNTTKVDGHHEEHNSQLHIAELTVTVADECVVRATVLNESSSGENKVKLMGAIVGEMASNMFGGDFYANNMKGSFDRNLNDR